MAMVHGSGGPGHPPASPRCCTNPSVPSSPCTSGSSPCSGIFPSTWRMLLLPSALGGSRRSGEQPGVTARFLAHEPHVPSDTAVASGRACREPGVAAAAAPAAVTVSPMTRGKNSSRLVSTGDSVEKIGRGGLGGHLEGCTVLAGLRLTARR